MAKDMQAQPDPQETAPDSEATASEAPGAGGPVAGAFPGLTTRRAPLWRRQSFWRAVGTLLSLALLVYMIRAQSWDEFLSVLRRLPAYTLFLAFGFTLCSRVLVSLRWFVLLRSAGVKLSFWQCLRLTFMGLFASNFLPTTIGGDLVRMAGAVTLRFDAGVSAASLVVDRLVGMLGMASLAPFGMAIVLRPVNGARPGVSWWMGFIPSLWSGLSSRLARLPGIGWLYRRFEKFARSVLRSSVYWLIHPASLLLALLCTYGHMLFTFLTVWLLLSEMNQSLSFWWIGALWSLNYFITTFLPFSINGLGLQEVTITYLYSHFGGVSMEAGLALSVLMRLLPMLASLPGALFLPDILRPLPAIPTEDVEIIPGQEVS